MEAKIMRKVNICGKVVRVFDVFGTPIVNTTPHEITFRHQDQDITVPAGDIIVNAKPVESVVREEGDIQFVRTEFQADPESQKIVDEMVEKTGAVIIGSIIAAQSFPGKVVAMTPAPGFERVPPAEKRMNPKKFTTFE